MPSAGSNTVPSRAEGDRDWRTGHAASWARENWQGWSSSGWSGSVADAKWWEHAWAEPSSAQETWKPRTRQDANRGRKDLPAPRSGGDVEEEDLPHASSRRQRRARNRPGNPSEDQSQEKLSCNDYECMICIQKVKRKDAIWSCRGCYASFHLRCLLAWARRSNADRTGNLQWQCPGCRYEHVGAEPCYTCFCGQARDPSPSPHRPAHTCGEVCGRSRGCPHPCGLLCHAGPCPPCTATATLAGACHCGLEAKDATRCGEPTAWSCGSPCGRPLPCGGHACGQRCHAGPCPPCSATSLTTCFCGKTSQERPCGQTSLSCRNYCGKELGCDIHVCEQLCHGGACPPCYRDPRTWGDRCACGQTVGCQQEAAAAYLVRWVGPRDSCQAPLPLCDKQCGRVRECGHACQKRCHDGVCGPCESELSQRCRCQRTTKNIKCSSQAKVSCRHTCKTKKTCGKHSCDVVCCEGFGQKYHPDHFCLAVCGRALSCGQHMCEDFCHLGKCQPCRVLIREPVTCACGSVALPPPVQCGTAPPHCSLPCRGVRDCDHLCLAPCHHGDHPLCCELVSRPCTGGHVEMPNQFCHIGAISCGGACKRPLPCGHDCGATCHTGSCPPCKQPCGRARRDCGHPCAAPCHEGTCPEAPCRHRLWQACSCGLRVEERTCTSRSCGSLACSPACERRPVPLTGLPTRAQRYCSDLVALASQQKRFVRMLEEACAACLSEQRAQRLPMLEPLRRMLAVDYVRLHWQLRTVAKSSDSWAALQLEPAQQAAVPKPLLSGVEPGSCSGPSLSEKSGQPRLRFSGVRPGFEEVYDLAGEAEGCIGVRQSGEGEACAFFQSGARAAAVFRGLTGQERSTEPVPLKGQAWSRLPLRVCLETLASRKPGPADKEARHSSVLLDSWEDASP